MVVAKYKALAAFFSIFFLVGIAGAFTASDGFPSRHLVALEGDYRSLVAEVSEEELKSQISKYASCDRNSKFIKSELDWCYQNGGAPQVAVIGDSHARALYLGIAESLGQRSSMLIARGACPPAIFAGITGVSTFDRCVSENRENFDYLLGNKNIRVVVLVAYGVTYSEAGVFGNVVRAGVLASSSEQSDDVLGKRKFLLDGLDAAVGELIAAGKKVVMVIDVPELGFNPSECVHARPYSVNLRNNCFARRSDVIDRQRNYREIVDQLKAKYGEMLVFDSLSVLCDTDKCYGSRDGHVLYHDDNHLGVFGSRLVAASLVNSLPKSW